MSIQFQCTERLKSPLQKAKKNYSLWLSKIASDHGHSIEEIQYIFCDDAYLIEINRQYLDHDDYTDIITFPYNDDGQPLRSDIYISTERVKENAEQFGVSFHNELLRVMAHGLLHLLGYSDKDDAMANNMRVQEDICINMFYSAKKNKTLNT